MCLSLITVPAAMAYGNERIQMEKNNFIPDEDIVVTISGVTAQMREDNANVVVYKGTEEIFWTGFYQEGTNQCTFTAPKESGEYRVCLFRSYWKDEITSVTFNVGTGSALNASEWAQSELKKADESGLIPDTIRNSDLSKPITRAEFAAVAVKVYENLSGTKTTPSATSTFTDTQNTDVLKAHNTGLMVGVSATAFEPNTLLNREQAATALTRVLKCAYIPGWSFATDGQHKLNFTRPATFADDARISDWAKESVYFMAANEIIKGVGDNKFAPKAITPAEQAAGYASATREQAIIIGARLVDRLKDKPLDYKQSEAPPATTTPPSEAPPVTTTPPSGKIDAKLVGSWNHNFYNMSGGGVTHSWYRFYADGTFKYTTTYKNREFYGKYSATDRKVYLSDVLWYDDYGAPTEHEKRVDIELAYEFGNNTDGKFLLIYALHRLSMDDPAADLQGAYEFLSKE
jgi:hypothetical protein